MHTNKKAITLGATSLSTIFVVLYWRHRHSRSSAEVTDEERRIVNREAKRAEKRVVDKTPRASFGWRVSKVQAEVMALLRRTVKPDE